MSPEARVAMCRCIALLRTMRGVTEEDVQAVSTYLGIIVEQAERGDECPTTHDARLQPSWPLFS